MSGPTGRRPDPIVFYEVGQVERWICKNGRPHCVWRAGFSRRADGGEQPWRTQKEARAETRTIGQRVRFVRK